MYAWRLHLYKLNCKVSARLATKNACFQQPRRHARHRAHTRNNSPTPSTPLTTKEWNCFHCFHCLAPRTQPIELKIEQERQHSPTRNCTKCGLDPCRFSPDMIKTSFTLFFLTKTTYKSHFQRRKACDSIRPHLPSIPSHFLESLSYKILKYRHCLPVPLIFRTVNFFFLPLWPAGGPVAPQ